MNLPANDRLVSSTISKNAPELGRLAARMATYYAGNPYPAYVHGLLWQLEESLLRDALCRQIPPCSRLLEVGCGDGSSLSPLRERVGPLSYVGCDLSLERWHGSRQPGGGGFAIASADTLPFPPGSFDVVLSIFVIEHLVFPARFLEGAWSTLKPGGRLLLVAPDFSRSPMPSERVGLSYGSGRDKLRRLRLLDALLTAYDTRVRIPRRRARRRGWLRRGHALFPVLTRPRCLSLAGFVPDCDAVYPACPDEILLHLSRQPGYASHELFYHDRYTFGLMASKRP